MWPKCDRAGIGFSDLRVEDGMDSGIVKTRRGVDAITSIRYITNL